MSPFSLVYVLEAVLPLEYIAPTLRTRVNERMPIEDSKKITE